jgi:hypothetical protein
LRDSPKKFQEFFKGSTILTETVRDKIFLVVSNLYFSNLSKGMQVDFSVAFHLVLVLDFSNVFPVRATSAQQREYMTKKPRLDL